QSHLKSVKGGSTGSGSEPSTPPPAHTPQRLARSPAHTPHVKQEPDSPYPALPPPLPPSHYEQTHLPSLEWRESDGAAGADAHKPAPVDLCVQPRIGTILASILALPNQQIDTAKTAKQTHTPVRKGGRFRTNWLTLYPWLQYDEMQNIMFCNGMGMAEMASMLTQQQMGNDSGDGEPILPPHPDQTDTIDGSKGWHMRLTFERVAGALNLHRCKLCGKVVTHIRNHYHVHFPGRFECPLCRATYTRSDNLRTHCKFKHPAYNPDTRKFEPAGAGAGAPVHAPPPPPPPLFANHLDAGFD
ncbi:hypothetical protein MSG28_008101, partial [Choristoneura fumiferana]